MVSSLHGAFRRLRQSLWSDCVNACAHVETRRVEYLRLAAEVLPLGETDNMKLPSPQRCLQKLVTSYCRYSPLPAYWQMTLYAQGDCRKAQVHCRIALVLGLNLPCTAVLVAEAKLIARMQIEEAVCCYYN